ncbi:MAG TPA: hypothetical protein VN930_05840 [Xanthobacteraceae bacterium]|nr:hypothetical protein [Xanthobacteraceae bacterium]
MRIFLGMIFGAFLTIFGAYLIDSYNAGPNAAPAQAEGRMVNWDVVDRNWQSFKTRVQSEWTRLSSSLKA